MASQEPGPDEMSYQGDHVDFRWSRIGLVTGKEQHDHLDRPQATVNSLPAAPVAFAGRGAVLDKILPVLNPDSDDLDTNRLPICVISGPKGIGTSALAKFASHLAVNKGWFPGGALYVDLQSHAKDPLTDNDALLVLVSPLGVQGAELMSMIPVARYGYYRDCLAQRPGRTLIVVDHVVRASQVELVMPGEDRHCVLVTSRGGLPDLDAHEFRLRALDQVAACEVLAALVRIGDAHEKRAETEPEALRDLAELCAGVPRNLRDAATGLRQNRDITIEEYVHLLRDRLAPQRMPGALENEPPPGRRKRSPFMNWRRSS
ncbi:hypothetical protein OG194_09090 [Streptomyces sp. NBC_01288]|uniref:hypothetical protein n=1 Tax=Streptomyces sp. NBC_01288 TaxID=2903814 RepID=UPI002E0DBFD1|nr:hypothetical protein OG194_09090 [Streptomyces sp. NBC_01288]